MSDSKSTNFSDADWPRLVRYLEGDLTHEETQATERWLADRRDRLELFARLREEWNRPALTDGAVQWDLDAVVGKMLARAATTRSEERHANGIPHQFDGRSEKLGWVGKRSLRGGVARVGQQTLRRYITAAAFVALGAIVIGLGRGSLQQQSEVARTYTTRTGQVARVTLSDGTQIVLGPQTTMRVAGFGSNARTVDINGLASFIVSRASGAPFIVRTRGATTRVLGTQFIVQRYGADARLHVAVVDGKVAVTAGTFRRRSPVVLTAGEVGEISDSLTVVRKADNIDSETSWLRDELAFNRTPVTEVLEALTRWYGYQFRLGDSTLTHESIRIALSTHSAPDALSMLKQVLDVDLTFTGDTITLTRRSAPHTPSETRRSTYDVWTPSKEVGR